MNQKSKVFFLSASGFPFKTSASNQKDKLIAKALNEAGFETTLFSKQNSIKNLDSNIGVYEGINYIFLSGAKRRTGILEKSIGIIIAYITEIRLLIKAKSSKRNYLILSYCSFPLVIYYWILCAVLKYKLIISIMEYHPVVARGLGSRINSRLFDNYAFNFSHAALPISHFLNEMIQKKHKNLPALILPVLADFNKIEPTALIKKPNYFLYCGSIGYLETIRFIVDSFLLMDRREVTLKLVLSGKIRSLKSFTEEIGKYKNISIYSDLSYKDLYEMYTDSLALLIPLRPVLQDKARFSQKIAEYLASGRPIITNKFGEIEFYFADSENAFVVEDYNKNQYSEKMKFILDNAEVATMVGKEGRTLGFREFHYQNFSSPLYKFLEGL
jgi:glycosyltransferase involved in cell wall biosynthesis